jgi:hypothetical protein
MILSSQVINENNWFFGCCAKENTKLCFAIEGNKASLKKAMIINMKK